MTDRFFVQVETFVPKNNKCRAFIQWIGLFDNALIVPGVTVDGGTFKALVQIIKNRCEALDKENPRSAPFKVTTADRLIFVNLKSRQTYDYNVARLIVKKAERLFEVCRIEQTDVAFYQYIESSDESWK